MRDQLPACLRQQTLCKYERAFVEKNVCIYKSVQACTMHVHKRKRKRKCVKLTNTTPNGIYFEKKLA